jgi:ABC-type branched-subunit amino acid transport system substrate-binding protein
MSAQVRAGAALALSGRYAFGGRDAARGLQAWADDAGVRLTIVDATSDDVQTARAIRELVGRHDLVFGPYGSGPMRAAQRELAGSPWVIWNHGAAAARPSPIRQIDVLAPAERYWLGLGDVLLERGIDLGHVVLVAAPSPFSRRLADGARDALAAHGATPLWVGELRPLAAAAAVAHAVRLGAQAIIGCGRREDDLALAGALRGTRLAVALVLCGIDEAASDLGTALVGWIGPTQWPPDGPQPVFGLPTGAQYPAAQAAAAGMVAHAALAVAGSADPDALWAAGVALRMQTHLGRFSVDRDGRQIGACPSLVDWVETPWGLERRTIWSPDASDHAPLDEPRDP